jgi:hypothetical protein
LRANGLVADSPGRSRSYQAVVDARQTRQGPSGRLVAKVPAPRRPWPRIRNGSPRNLSIVLVTGSAAGQPSEKDWKGQMPVRGRVEPKGAGGGPATETAAAIRTWLIGIAVALAIAWTLRQTVWITLPLSVALFIASAYGPSVAASGSAYPGGLNSSATPPPWRSSCCCYPCSSRPSGTPHIASSPSSHATPAA